MLLTNNQFFESKLQPKIPHNSSNMIQFPEIPMLESLNEVLEKNGGNRLNHFHSSLQRSQVNTNSPLSSLFSTSKPTLNTFF